MFFKENFENKIHNNFRFSYKFKEKLEEIWKKRKNPNKNENKIHIIKSFYFILFNFIFYLNQYFLIFNNRVNFVLNEVTIKSQEN